MYALQEQNNTKCKIFLSSLIIGTYHHRFSCVTNGEVSVRRLEASTSLVLYQSLAFCLSDLDLGRVFSASYNCRRTSTIQFLKSKHPKHNNPQPNNPNTPQRRSKPRTRTRLTATRRAQLSPIRSRIACLRAIPARPLRDLRNFDVVDRRIHAHASRCLDVVG
jgi:hypothetical protein